MSDGEFRQKSFDSSELILRHYDFVGIDDLSFYLSEYQLRHTKFISEKEYMMEWVLSSGRIKSILRDLVSKNILKKYKSDKEIEKLNLPVIKLAELAIWHEGKQNQYFKCPQVILDKFQVGNVAKVVGKRQGVLSEAIEHAYNKLRNQGNTRVLIGGKPRDFWQCLKAMATVGNVNADEYILERIESVKIPKNGGCSLITKAKIAVFAEHTRTKEGKHYNENAVSKILTKLRKKYPLPA